MHSLHDFELVVEWKVRERERALRQGALRREARAPLVPSGARRLAATLAALAARLAPPIPAPAASLPVARPVELGSRERPGHPAADRDEQRASKRAA